MPKKWKPVRRYSNSSLNQTWKANGKHMACTALLERIEPPVWRLPEKAPENIIERDIEVLKEVYLDKPASLQPADWGPQWE